MQQARMIKLPEEIALLEEATAIADAVTASGLSAIAPGIRECEMAAEAMRTLFRLGGEYAHVMTPFVASGENMAPPHRICSDKIVATAIWFSSILVPTGTVISATWRVPRSAAKPLSSKKDLHRGLRCTKAGIEEMRPGRTNKDAAQAVVERCRQTWLGGSFPVLVHWASGSASAPTSRRISERRCPEHQLYEFQPGMVFAVEPLIWVEGVRGGGGVRLEEQVLITKRAACDVARSF